jgi:anaerobic ribonucleoside-triphosphate reductase
MSEDKQEAITKLIAAIGKSAERTECQIFTRVMGYHRPVESFNLGKKGEHQERVKFVEEKTNPKLG